MSPTSTASGASGSGRGAARGSSCAIALFGPGRCMFASNFPVDGVCASYDTIFDGFKEIVADLPDTDQRRLFRDNALREYRIKL